MLIVAVSQTLITAALPVACFIFICLLTLLSGTVLRAVQYIGKQAKQFSENVLGDVELNPKFHGKILRDQEVLVPIYNLNSNNARPLKNRE